MAINKDKIRVRHFTRLAQALRNCAEPPITIADGRRAIELVTAVYYSMHTGQVVELPIGPNHLYYASCIPEDAAPIEEFTDFARNQEKSRWKPRDV